MPNGLPGSLTRGRSKVLGVTRAQMLRDGKITVPEMFNDAGEFLTLDELRRVDASAFEG
jgi:hypothetical protein